MGSGSVELKGGDAAMVASTGARLIAEEGALSGTVLTLEGSNEWVMGRDPDECRIVIEDPLVSRRHARCLLTPEGGITIENLSQTNPIKINDEDLTGQHLLEEGDQIRMGSSAFRFYSQAPQIEELIPEEAGSIAAEPPAAGVKRHDTFFQGEKAPAITEEELFSKFGIDLDTGNRWMVKIISGPNAGAEYSLQPGRAYVVGNDASGCEIILLDASVSRKHARLTIGEDQKVFLEDLQSKNGTLLNGEKVQKKTPLEANQLISLGTSTMVLIDREGERSTIVSPPLGMLGKVLLSHETIQAAAKTAVEKANAERASEQSKIEEQKEETPPPKEEAPVLSERGALFFKIGVAALLALGTIGITTLFRSSDVQVNRVDENETIAKLLAPFPKVKWSFTKSTGVLLLLGHVSTATERSQILFNLQGLNFITRLDDQIVIDEYVWQETNLILAKNPAWRSVTLQAPEPGHFVLTGYLKTQKEADLLNDYMSVNFRYLDLLENRVVVEEGIIKEIQVRLAERQLTDITVAMTSGEVTLNGMVPSDKVASFQELLAEIKDMQGVRAVRNYVVEVGNQEAYIDLSNDYRVSGFSEVGNTTVDVVIDGKILAKGDNLNGMKITDIKNGVIYLEKQGFKYKIIFKK